MEFITSKAAVKSAVATAMMNYEANGMPALVAGIEAGLLQAKIRFPLLEFAARELYAKLPIDKQVPFLDAVIALKTIGGNVIAGIILQQRLVAHFDEAVEKATAYIIHGNEWYVCDIIGERVLGHALLTMPEQTIPVLKQLATHNDKWMVRSVGVATHYAVKKGLKKQYVDEVFQLLLTLADATEFHTKKGVGWAVKTTAKFHPEIVERHRDAIATAKQWFKTKVGIGLGRTAKYANRYTS